MIRQTPHAANFALKNIANDIAPMTLSEFGELLAKDFFESPEALASYFHKSISWTTKVRTALVSNRLIDEASFWFAFKTSASRQRPCVVLPPLEPGSAVVNNLNL